MALAAAERLHGGGVGWAWLAGAAALAALAVSARRPLHLLPGLAALGAAALGAVLVVGAVDVLRIQCCWPERRDALVERAFLALQAALEDGKREARRLAERAMAAAALPRPAQFDRLEAAVASTDPGVERGVAVLDPTGRPYAWAGRHRLVPAGDTAPFRAIITPFYLTLEARRQTPDGATAVGTVLLDAAPAIADRGGALSVAFARRHGVALRFLPPGTAPLQPDVFDYATDEGDTLFSVQPLPPTQGEATLAAVSRTSRRARVGLVAVLLLIFVCAPQGAWRWGVVLTGTWALARAAQGAGLGAPPLISSATFDRPALGPFGASAGAAAVLGILLLVAGGAVWRRGGRRTWWRVAAALALVVAAPYVVRYLGRGIAPPTGGVGLPLWLLWQFALATNGMALVLMAAGLVRGPAEPTRIPWILPAASAWAVTAAIAGLWLWQPYGAWPDWYTFFWLPALLGVLVPAPRRWMLAGIATVAGTAAALVTWNAALEGRLALANGDVHRLGREGDSLAVAALERLGHQVLRAPPAVAEADLYAVWLHSPLAAGAYPTILTLWTPDGRIRADLRLADLDLPAPLLDSLAREALAGAPVPKVLPLERIPGVHYVLATRLSGGDVLTVGVGPRSRLLAPDRVAQFLRGEPLLAPPYTISLSLPGTVLEQPSGYVAWRREGWSARGEQRVDLPGGVRHVHVRVELGGPWGLMVRGVLVVLLNLTLVGLAWGVSLATREGGPVRVPAALATLRASYRARLTAALAAFFVLPLLAFAVWSLARLGDEVRRAGDLLTRQTLRDAVASGSAVALQPTPTARRSMVELGSRLDADLWIYRDGVLSGASAPVLVELGLVDPFLSAVAYRPLAFADDLELTADGRVAGRPVRVGYRVVRADPPGELAILAAPQLLDDQAVRREQEELALALVLATLAGLGAAGLLAGLAARGLTEPIAALRDAAVAVGRGATPPAFPRSAPQEFEAVMSAFERMAGDVRFGREALEEARQRTARVLANVATGVVAVDGRLRVTLANPRASELLGARLDAGTVLPQSTAPAWSPVWLAVREFIAGGGEAIAERGFDIDGRQIRVQLAAIGPPPDGCVVALDDTTALTRAARVLAWGELARQVAHEIKNPLTPIRLGIQHLQRAREARGGGGKASFDATLQETAARILTEIDRLDGIARAFARFGAPAAETTPLELVDVFAIAQEVVQLYALGRRVEGATRFEVAGEAGAPALARRDEVKEVLVNLLENARQAGASRVVVSVAEGGRRLTVEDDGRGIPAESLARVFEPTFSTTSSGSGLGLPIARRLVESWGGTIAISSLPRSGTQVTIGLRAWSGG